MKVKLYVEGLNAWKSRRWITSKKEFDLLLNILMGGMQNMKLREEIRKLQKGE